MGFEAFGDRACVGLSRQYSFALRRAGLHGIGDAWREIHAGRMAKSLFANERRSAEVPLPRRLHDAEYAARHAGKSANARDF